MKPALVDVVSSQKLLVVFLVNGCKENDPEEALLSRSSPSLTILA